MHRKNCEIHHSRDAYEKYAAAMKHLRQPVGMHHHVFYEIYFFLSGDLDYQIESRIYHMRPGNLLLIRPSEMHQPIFVPAKGFYERIVLWLEPEYLQELSSSNEDLTACFQASEEHPNNLICLNVQKKEMLLNYMDHLVEVEKENGPYAKTQENAYVSLILSMINEAAFADTHASSSSMAEYFSPYTAEAVKYIALHLNQPLSTAQLASKLSISVQYLLKVFRADMGITIHQYIVQKRILTAHQYMGEGMSSSHAAERCGFDNYTTFWREYKKEYGVPPGKHTHV